MADFKPVQRRGRRNPSGGGGGNRGRGRGGNRGGGRGGRGGRGGGRGGRRGGHNAKVIGLSEEFILSVRERMLDFRESSDPELLFPSTLSPAERKYVHQACQDLGLASKSRGKKGVNRYLTVSRKVRPLSPRNNPPQPSPPLSPATSPPPHRVAATKSCTSSTSTSPPSLRSRSTLRSIQFLRPKRGKRHLV